MTLAEFIEAVEKLWPIFLSIIGGGAWFIRLEAKVLQMEKEIREIKDHSDEKEKTLWDKFEKVMEKIQGVAEALARLEGQLLGKKEN